MPFDRRQNRRGLAAAAAVALALVAPDARALDCSKAREDVDKTICSDPAAKTADEAMGAAYVALKARLPAKDAPALLASQRAWVERRNYSCDASAADGAACLARISAARAAFLEGRPEGGSYGAGAFQPVLASRKPKGKGDWDISVSLAKFANPASPAEKAFNAAVDKQFAEAPLRSPRDPDVEALSYGAAMRVTWASGELIAAEIALERYEGGAHPTSGTDHVTIDGRTGKALAFRDVFDDAGAKKAIALCETQVIAQRKEKGAEQDGGGASAEGFTSLPEAFREIAAWRFAAAETEVIFDVYSIGSYAEGEYSCTFPNGALRPLVKAGFPLPP